MAAPQPGATGGPPRGETRSPGNLGLETLLQALLDRGGSDLHLSAGSQPRIRIHGRLVPVESARLDPDTTRTLIYSVLRKDQREAFEQTRELDVSFGIKGLGRFRMNVFLQRGAVGAAIRLVPFKVPDFAALGLPIDTVRALCELPRGLILVTGTTGSGKSTTLASMLDHVNATRSGHIVTIEDPIEFVHFNRGCLVDQREVGSDTHGFRDALRRVFRQDPDVVLIGEIRDTDTMETALTIAETGHLTLASLHTADAVGTVHRIVDAFPQGQQERVCAQLAYVLSGVLNQKLLPNADGDRRVLAVEVLLATPAVRGLIREGKIHQIYSTIQTGVRHGMRTMNQALLDLVGRGQVRLDVALAHSPDPEEFARMAALGMPG